MNNTETVKAIYEAFGGGDVVTILTKLDDAVEWEEAVPVADVPWLQARRGKHVLPRSTLELEWASGGFTDEPGSRISLNHRHDGRKSHGNRQGGQGGETDYYQRSQRHDRTDTLPHARHRRMDGRMGDRTTTPPLSSA